MDELIKKKLIEWTKDSKTNLEARISIFERIRDIPYAIRSELRDPVLGPQKMLELNSGSCIAKHFLLKQMFEELGLKVKLVSYEFFWQDLSIKYPPKLWQVVKDLPKLIHLACKVLLQDHWVLVDASFDLAVGKYGFPVNLSWDGFNSTANAVLPVKEIEHNSLADRLEYYASFIALLTDEQKLINAKFIELLNAWLADARK